MANVLDPICDSKKGTRLELASEIHIGYAKDYLAVLRSMSHGSEENPSPEKTLKVGAYCLHNLNRLLQVYEECLPSSMNHESIRSMIDTLQVLEFNPTHITIDGDIESVPVEQVPQYYELLLSRSKQDIRSFIKMVVSKIAIPAKRFSTSFAESVQSAIFKELIQAIKNNDLVGVEKSMKRWDLVDSKDDDGRTALHHAVDQGNIDIVRTLLIKKAEIVLLNNNDDTLLNLALFKGSKNIEQVLLQHVDVKEMIAFVDARTISCGTTSLHIAAKNGSLDVVKCLLRYGASYNIEDKNGKTPLDVSNDEKVCELLKSVDKLELECQLDELDVLKWASEHYFDLTKFCLVKLGILADVNGSKHNIHPRRTFMEGSWYLHTTFRLLAMYKDCAHLSIDNESLDLVNDMLRTLEFGLKHTRTRYKYEAYVQEVRCREGKGTKYYKLLRSELTEDVRSFIEMVKLNIDKPIRMFFLAIVKRIESRLSDELLGVEDCKDDDGRTPLHYTDGGNTPLHLACSNGDRKLVEMLLQNVSPDKKTGFINARTTSVGTTSLHIAAENGFLEIVKCLVEHGANFLIENKERKIPVELSNDEAVVEFLNSFMQASVPDCGLDQLEKLKDASKNLMNDSVIHISMLRRMLTVGIPVKDTFKISAHYLGKAHQLVELYVECAPGPIDNQFIRSVNDILRTLEFDPEHIIQGNWDVAHFKGRVPKYYQLSQSELGKDITSFITMIENNIFKPVRSFFEQVNHKFQSLLCDKFLKAINNDDHSEVFDCIVKGVVVNFKNTDGRTPLHHAVDRGNLPIVRSLLMNGAEVSDITEDGSTPLHLACSKGDTEIVELLLRHVNPDKRIEFVNARTTSGGTSLHIAAKNGFLGIVKWLLKHGANCIIENKEGKIPVELSNDQKVVEFLNSFVQAGVPGCVLDQLGKLKTASKNLMNDSLIHISMLRHKLLGGISDKDIVKKCAHYLGKAHQLVELYKEFVPGSIINEFIRSVNDILRTLEFDSDHIIQGNWDVAYFKGRVPKYFELLQSQLVEDVRSFIAMVENNIDKPVRSFFEQMNHKFQSFLCDELFKAINNGNHSEVFDCIVKGVDVNFKNTDGRTPLHHAVDSGNLPIVRSLLMNGAKVCDITEDGSTSLHLACSKGDTAIVKLLLCNINPDKRFEFVNDVDSNDTEGRTPLHCAVNTGNVEIVNTLLEKGVKVDVITNNGSTPLHLACSNGYPEIVEVLLQNINPVEKIDFIDARTNCGTTSLHLAAKNGFLDIVECLLEHGASYNIENKEGKTPVDLSNDQNVCQFLNSVDHLFRDIKNGNCDFSGITNARDNEGNTLLKIAVLNGHENVAKKLLDMLHVEEEYSLECDLNQLKKLQSYSKYHIFHTFSGESFKEGTDYLTRTHRLVELYKNCLPGSINNPSIRSVNYILEALEFDPIHIKSEYIDERVPIYYKLLHSKSFVRMIQLNIDEPVKRFLESIDERLHSFIGVQLLWAIKNEDLLEAENCIETRVDLIEFKDPDGRTPLHHAVNRGNIDILRYLLILGAKVTETTNRGNTPLHLASFKGYRKIVQVLLNNVSPDEKMDFINAKTNCGTTSLHVAAKHGYLDIVKCLLNHGANYNIRNKEGKRPVDISNDKEVVKFLTVVEKLFVDTKNGHFGDIGNDELLEIAYARDNQGRTLLQVAVDNGRKNIASRLLKMMFEESDRGESRFSPECDLDRLAELKSAAEKHVSMSHSHPIEDGRDYLGRVYRLVELYKKSIPGSINDKNIRLVNNTLRAVEVDEGCDREVVKSLSWMLELDIDKPVARFLESIDGRLQSCLGEKLLGAIDNDNLSEVKDCIERGLVVNFKDTDGRTALLRAVEKGRIDIVRSLLMNGAEAKEITTLRIATSQGYTEIVELLLEYVSRDELIDFINDGTNYGGATSLHVAAENGYLDIVKCLLKHGAIYNIRNKVGDMPVDLSNDQKVITLLKLVDELFQGVKNGDLDAIGKLKTVKSCEFICITNARDNHWKTLFQFALDNGRKNVVGKFLELLNDRVSN